MKILFTLESFFPSHRAGTEVYVLNLCRYFKNNGWDVGVLITTKEQQSDYKFEEIDIYTFNIPEEPDARELNGLIAPRGMDSFLIRVKEFCPDVIHFHSFGRAINSYHLKAVHDLGIKTVFTPHLGGQFCIKGDMRLFNRENCDGEIIESRCLNCVLQNKGYKGGVAKGLGEVIAHMSHTPFLKNRLPASFSQAKHRKAEMKRIDSYADIVFSIAPWIQEAFKANGVNKAKLIPQGISPLFFRERNKTQILENRQEFYHFAFIGRMHPSKGFHLLASIWEQVSPKSTLHIITNPSGGESDFFNKHKKWASNTENVIWNEALSQKEVSDYLDKVDVLILPSISNEVAPLVILEAATRQIPVIGSDYVAIKGMINHNVNGLLFENGNSKDLLKQIEKIISKEEILNNLKNNVGKPKDMNEVAVIVENSILELF
ncbi:glycosyltransferase [Formosa sp. 3Alg 14/1]|uniref:glycosyltransferase n=1 Tax=Formosa sp. 3Alg 14/1 TaxID=3382190 RepID=UPI0039BE631B